MNQLDYQPTFPPGSFFHNQPLPQSFDAGQDAALRQQFQQQQAQQYPQQFQPQQQEDNSTNNARFTSAPFSQPVQAGPVSAAAQQAGLRQSASPNQPNSPFSAVTPQQPQIKYPMAAPPLPHPPQQAGTSVSGNSTPQSPGAQSLEQSRIKLLLEINGDLLQEISTLQEQGKGGATNPQHQAQLKQLNLDDKMATEQYIHTLRRVQANLAYLAPRGQMAAANAKTLPGPAHMTPPPHMPQLQPKYDKLRELFPTWSGMDLARPTNINGTTA